MKRSTVILCLLGSLFFIQARATHIVGGELELVHIRDFTYQARMVIYFDKFNGEPGALDPQVEVSIFRRSDSEFIRSLILPLIDSADVLYSNPDCAVGSLDTDRLFYAANIGLPPEVYNDPAGYEIVWERCCRNNVIDNVFYGDPPEINTVGQTFILEFPPVVDSEGKPFINSSPILFPPLRDFACDNQFYYVDFAGTDPDGDSIVYSLSNPLNSTTTEPAPTPTPAPHPEVQWVPGFSETNMIPGNPSLAISDKGLVTVTPTVTGLFVFAVRAEEFRDGIKIGEVRRDFQMLVLNCPDPGTPPKVQAQDPRNSLFLNDLDTVRFAIDEEKCLNFFVQDADGKQTVNLKALPVNFAGAIDSIFSLNQGALRDDLDTLAVEICVPDCPFKEGDLAVVDLVGLDSSCPLPLQDTLRLIFDVEAPANEDPFFTNDSRHYVFTIREGEVIQLPMTGIDPDGDTLVFETFTDGFSLDDFGIEVDTVEDSPGEVKTKLFWDTDCQVWDFSSRTSFELTFTLNDKDACNFVGDPDTITVQIHVELPPNTDPVISTNLVETNLEVRLEETVEFEVLGSDSDNDLLSLVGLPDGFQFENAGIGFQDAEGLGHVSSSFTWVVGCNPELLEQEEYRILFMVEDFDKCKFPNSDSLEVVITILPPENERPQAGIVERTVSEFDFKVGQVVDLVIFGQDSDSDDLITLRLDDSGQRAPGIEFENVQGMERVNSPFQWEIDCSHLGSEAGPRSYSFEFVVSDDDCVEVLGDTISLIINVEDIVSDPDISVPPNVFTPNGDGINDVYFIPNLPADNCVNKFEYIRIYNRWGGLVFEDDTRDFLWNGAGSTPGVYYWQVQYNNFEYRGIVSIRD